MRTRHFFVILMAALLHSVRLAAAPADDFRQIAHAYETLEIWSVSIKYALFSTYSCLNPQVTEQGLYIKKGQCEYLKVASIENITSPTFGLMADNEARTLSVFTPAGKSLNPLNPELALRMCEKVTPVEAKDGSRGYYFLFRNDADPELAGISILFNDKTWLVTRVVMFYKSNLLNDRSLSDKPRMEITYQNYNLRPQLAEGFFTLKRYVKGMGEKMQGQQEYEGYSVSDYRR